MLFQSVINSLMSTTMTMNTAKFLISLALLLLSSWAGAITYTYDEANRLTSVTYDDGGKVAYVFDATGNISSITKNPPGAGATTTTTAPGSTTTTAATTTTTASTTTTTNASTGGGQVTLNVAVGWNLIGNSASGVLNVASAFGDSTKVTTVWKWIAGGAKWAFFAPSLAGQQLIDYAATKGYEVLTTVSGGEGFWVNAKTAFTAQLPSGTAVTSASYRSSLVSGWNLISIGDSKTPSEFNSALSATPPASGVIPLNLTTLWAWDAALTNWYFYAPSLDANGGLGNYIAGKGYLDFGTTKTLGPGVGFWVNKP